MLRGEPSGAVETTAASAEAASTALVAWPIVVVAEPISIGAEPSRPPPASPLFAEITPNMVIKYARAADRAMALLKNAELSVEDELLERNSLETDPTPVSKTRQLEGRPPLAASLANDRVEEDSGLLRRGASFDEDADLDHERSVVAEEEASGRTVFDAVRKVGWCRVLVGR